MWSCKDQKIYGVHGNSGYLFSFSPPSTNGEKGFGKKRPLFSSLVLIDRLTSLPSKRFGLHDQFSYGYLGFTLSIDEKYIYYLTGAPIILADGSPVRGKAATAKGESKGLEYCHLVSFALDTYTYTDHGPIFFSDGHFPTYVNSLAASKDGYLYSLGRLLPTSGKTDLFRIKAPHGINHFNV